MKFLGIVNMMDIKKDQQVWFAVFFDKKTGVGMGVNEELAQELYKPVIKKFKNRKFILG